MILSESLLGVASANLGFVNTAINITNLNNAYYQKISSIHGGEIGVFNVTGNATNIPSEITASQTAGIVLSCTRIGGDEFLVLQIYLPEDTTSGALHVYMRCGRFLKTAIGSETFNAWRQIF